MSMKFDNLGQPCINIGDGTSPTLAVPGTITLPGGLIMKWGTASAVGATSTQAVTFGTAFPTGILGAWITGTNTGGSSQAADTVTSATTAGFTVNNAGSVSRNFNWLALGY